MEIHNTRQCISNAISHLTETGLRSGYDMVCNDTPMPVLARPNHS